MSHQIDDPALDALNALGVQLDQTIDELRAAGERLEQLARLRADGRSWSDIVSNEERPLIVETITRALDDLGAFGGRFRREEALALQREDISINQIGRLFGVSRQRISALVSQRRAPERGTPGTTDAGGPDT